MTARPRPVLTAAGISGLITSIAGVLAFLGYTDQAGQLSGQAQTLGSIGIALVLGALHAYAGLKVQAKVTPVASPLDVDGVPLVRQAAPASVSALTPAPDPESAAGERLDMIPDAPEPAPAVEASRPTPGPIPAA